MPSTNSWRPVQAMASSPAPMPPGAVATALQWRVLGSKTAPSRPRFRFVRLSRATRLPPAQITFVIWAGVGPERESSIQRRCESWAALRPGPPPVTPVHWLPARIRPGAAAAQPVTATTASAAPTETSRPRRRRRPSCNRRPTCGWTRSGSSAASIRGSRARCSSLMIVSFSTQQADRPQACHCGPSPGIFRADSRLASGR